MYTVMPFVQFSFNHNHAPTNPVPLYYMQNFRQILSVNRLLRLPSCRDRLRPSASGRTKDDDGDSDDAAGGAGGRSTTSRDSSKKSSSWEDPASEPALSPFPFPVRVNPAGDRGDTGLAASASRFGPLSSGTSSSSTPSPYPSPPVLKAGGIFRPEIFWKPRSPGAGATASLVVDDRPNHRLNPGTSGVSLDRCDAISADLAVGSMPRSTARFLRHRMKRKMKIKTRERPATPPTTPPTTLPTSIPPLDVLSASALMDVAELLLVLVVV